MPGLSMTQFQAKKPELIGKMIYIEGKDDLGNINFRGKIKSIDKAHFPGLIIILDESEAKRDHEPGYTRCNKISLALKMYGWFKFWLEEDGTIRFPPNISDHQGYDYRRIYIAP